ncbi:hypothetical protein pb186bvf_015113 [Paramecium bursaria]
MNIEQTHQLIDKIELRVKQFMKTSSTKQLTIRKDNFNQLENIPPINSRFSETPLLKEIQEIDQSYKQEIDILNIKLQEQKQLIDNLKQTIQDQQQQLIQKQKTIDQYQQENDKQKILIQTLRDENNFVTTEVQQLINSQNSPKLLTLQKDVIEEKLKSEKLQLEILDIKQRVEKQRDSVKNNEFGMMEKLVKKLEDAQESQMKQNQQFMKCVINFLDRSSSSRNSQVASVPRRIKPQSAQKARKN